MNDTRPVLMPKARKHQLIVKELSDETLVYDLDTNKAHCLNDTAGRVWKNCDGRNSVAEIRATLSNETGVAIDEGVVWLALDQLEEFKLLDQAPTAQGVFAGMSRRQLMRNMGIAAVTLPMIVSIVAPTFAQAVSPCGQPCSNPSNCNSNPPGCKTCVPVLNICGAP